MPLCARPLRDTMPVHKGGKRLVSREWKEQIESVLAQENPGLLLDLALGQAGRASR